jgi:antitoxin MazE
MTTAKAQLVKWGNSHAIRLPKQVLSAAEIAEGDDLVIRVENGCIAIQPAEPKLTLKDLVARITPANHPSEQDWGEPVGGEVW